MNRRVAMGVAVGGFFAALLLAALGLAGETTDLTGLWGVVYWLGVVAVLIMSAWLFVLAHRSPPNNGPLSNSAPAKTHNQ